MNGLSELGSCMFSKIRRNGRIIIIQSSVIRPKWGVSFRPDVMLMLQKVKVRSSLCFN